MIHHLDSMPRHEPAASALRPATDTISIADVLENYDNWGVPHFQRGSVWGADNISALLESLYHDTPCGSIILWAPNDIEAQGVPLVTGRACSHLIIDGQQRTRSVYAAFKGLFDVTQAAVEMDDGRHSEISTDGAERQWAINLNELTDFDSLLHRSEKRLWPLFVPVPDPYRAEEIRQQTITKRKRDGNVRSTIPESPFKYNFVPLHHFTSGNLETALKQGRLFIKRKDGSADWTNRDTAPILAQLERLRVKVQEMKTRRLFRKVLGEEVTLDLALKVFIRINSGGRPVQMEEKGFSILVGSAPRTSDWVKQIFASVHGHGDPSRPDGIERDSAMKRMNERSFGFKLFIRVFMLATNYHTGRAIGAQSLSFGALQDRRFVAMLEGDPATYEQLWSATADAVVAMHQLLENRLELDALQFLPETTSLFPLFLCLIKYPGLMENRGSDGVRVRPEFEAGMARAALLLLLRDFKTREVMKWANDVANTQDDAAALLERFGSVLTVERLFFTGPLRSANSLTNRYTLLLYGLQRSRKARDFNYPVNKLTTSEFNQVERRLARGCEPEKQHIVPYSQLIEAYDLESASRISSTPANNIGNMTYISHAQNSLGGLSDALVELGMEDATNFQAHFISTGRAAYDDVKRHLEADGEPRPETLKELYESWIAVRQDEIAEGFVGWAGNLQQEWVDQVVKRQGRPRVEPAPPILGTGGLAHRIRALGLANAIEDGLIQMFSAGGWLLESDGHGSGGGPLLILSLRHRRRTLVRNVRVSLDGLTVPCGPDGMPGAIQFDDPDAAREQLGRFSADFESRRKSPRPEPAPGDRETDKKEKRVSISLVELLADIDKAGGADAHRTAETLLGLSSEFGGKVSRRDASASVRVRNLATNRPCTLFVLTRKATFYIGFLGMWRENAGVGPECGVAYEAALTKILGRNPRVGKGDLMGAEAVPLAEVAAHIDEVLVAVRRWAALLKAGRPAASAADAPTPER